ncbi:MAG: bifunctional YncE family protein/alkaline phosphatase family protein [Phycisphaerales bacterium]|nr:bifunctional YncE family protein/alkaline phosphatase family protein [Phycisphaerales bacterium]
MRHGSARRWVWLALVAGAWGIAAPVLGQQEPPPERKERLELANPPEDKDAGILHGGIGRSVRALPGLQSDGQVVLPNQWSLRPAGRQVELGDFPVNVALHPTQPYAAVLHAGHGVHEIEIVDLGTRRVVSSVTLPQTFYGIAFDAAGGRLYASGGEEDLVHSFAFGDGLLSDHVQIPVVDPKAPFVVAGVTPSPDGSSLYVCGAWGHELAIVPVSGGGAVRLVEMPKNSYPYLAIAEAGGGGRVFVSLWGGSGVAVVDPASDGVLGTWPTPSHPTEMVLSPDGGTLFVACSNSTSVVAIDTATGRMREVITTSLYPGAPNGSTPNSLSLSPDGSLLAVANADNNNLAVFNVETPGSARSLGFVPTGWYPTSVRFRPTGGLVYLSGKGLGSRANRAGPNPLASAPGGIREYIGGLFRGTLGILPDLKAGTVAAYTRSAYAASPLAPDAAPSVKTRETDNPIPASVGGKSPITHCIYIIKENRTFDQILGDMPEGNGEPDLCIFPERVTPNHHAIAREFVLLDNFYVESEVSADGHEWSMAAYATDFVEKTWPLTYRGWRPKQRELAYPSEGVFEIAVPAGGYLWDRCREAGVSYRSYGEWVSNGARPGEPGRARVEALEGHFDPLFRSFDVGYPDAKRADRFLEELARFEDEGEMPRLQIVRLPSDHTAGAQKGMPTPTAMVADNDLALGRVIEGISRSKFWASTAVFVVEDDAQNGSDHVDAHRTIAFVVSPYTKRHFVDSSLYSTTSMLRTMELILGLQPMSQFDAAALPMYHSFTATPDLTPFTHRPAGVDTEEKNLASAWGSDLSESFDFAEEDGADDLLLNEVVWRSVRGPQSAMPPPVRAAFVRTAARDDEDDRSGEAPGADEDDD